MTSLVSWIGIDSRGQSSVYIASDSRISWNDGKTWDYGRKIFASRKHPDILGYIGDVQFPSLVLGQLIDMIDDDLLFANADSPQTKQNKLSSIIRRAFKDYPKEKSHPFTIVYCTRENSGMASIFHVSTLSWQQNRTWLQQWLEIPKESGIIKGLGSGRESIESWYSKWSKTNEGRTSRSVFSAFCDSLKSGEDKRSGGAPQLVGIYRKGTGESFGIIYNRKRYLLGLPVDKDEKLDVVEWRNDIFERCDWRTKKVITGAQRHSRPRELE